MSDIRVLMVDSEPLAAREERRQRGRPTACESFITTLHKLRPGLACDRLAPVDGPVPAPDWGRYAAALFSGSPLHFQEDTPQTRRVIAFARALFHSGLPCFGSCAGLQIATVAGGGRVGPKASETELGIARGITRAAGRTHAMLEGRPPAFDATAIHGDEVKQLPDGALLVATNSKTRVQAAEMRLGKSVFWGVQYHPEISLKEVAAALGTDMDGAVQDGFARDRPALETHLARLEALDNDPSRKDLAWQLGLDAEVIDFQHRTRELQNFLAAFVPQA